MSGKYKCRKYQDLGQLLYFYGIILATISPSPTQPPTSDKQLLVLLLLSAALHLLLLWKDTDKKTNNGKGATAFLLQFIES